MPCRPRKCCGKKITFTPTKVIQKCAAPRNSLSLIPNIFSDRTSTRLNSRPLHDTLPTDEKLRPAHDRDHVADAGHVIPERERVRIVDVSARHALQTQEVLREEDQVHADEGDPEVRRAQELVILDPEHLLRSDVHTSELPSPTRHPPNRRKTPPCPRP